jgi:hypothetical protein
MQALFQWATPPGLKETTATDGCSKQAQLTSELYATWAVARSFSKLIGCNTAICETIFRLSCTHCVFKPWMNILYRIPAGRDAALIRRIQRRRYWRFFFRRSLYDDDRAFKLRWLAVRNNVEWAPRKPRLRSKILLRRLRATVPRFTLVIRYVSWEGRRFHWTKRNDE